MRAGKWRSCSGNRSKRRKRSGVELKLKARKYLLWSKLSPDSSQREKKALQRLMKAEKPPLKQARCK
jgi:hypothetical protein